MPALERLLALIKEYGTVHEFGDFLRSKDIPGTGTWDELLYERVPNAMAEGSLTVADLYDFLRSAEEYGRQHVFLYRQAAGHRHAPDDRAVRKWAASVDAVGVLQQPIIVDTPSKPTITEIRREPTRDGDRLIVKIVETRVHDEFLGTQDHGGGRYTKDYQRHEVRAVNLIVIHPDGLVEVRVHSHRSASRDYAAPLALVWGRLSDLISPTACRAIPLTRAKRTIYESRRRLATQISFSGTSLRSSSGSNVAAACGREMNLFDDEDVEAGIAAMTAAGRTFHDTLNIWWLKQASGRPSKNIHMWLAGLPNEFCITTACNREDYEYVIGQLQGYNR